MENKMIVAHVVFALKYSRFGSAHFKRKKPVGFITRTIPFIEGKAEELLLEVMLNVAIGLQLNIIAFNFCGDHVHVLIKAETDKLGDLIGNWKGKTAYNFNRRRIQPPNSSNQNGNQEKNQSLWSKGFYSEIIHDSDSFNATIEYILKNRSKHGLPALSKKSQQYIDLMVKLNEYNEFP